MTLKRAGALVCFLLFFYALSAHQLEFRFTAGCVEAQKHLRCLRIEKARQLLEAERKADPNNVAVDYLDNFADFYQILTSQQASDLKRLEPNQDIRIGRIKRSNPASPWVLSAQAEINLQWAFARVFFQEFLTAAWEIRSAYQLIEVNRKRFPAFLPDKKNMGLMKSVLGTIPDNYKWVLSIAGMKGNLEEGLGLIRSYLNDEHFAQQQPALQQSAQFYYALLLLNFGDKNECWNFCAKVTADHDDNLMSCYLRGFAGMKTGHNDEAIRTLLNRPTGPEYAPFVALDYFLGSAKLNRLDHDADIYLKKFVTFNKGPNLVKEAYKRLSWHYLLLNDTVKFNVYRGLSRKYGAVNSDEDRNAQREAESGMLPEPLLIRARVLFDGGYYAKAEESIRQLSVQELKGEYRVTEYFYRYGRIMHEANKLSKAIELYNQAIRMTVNSSTYFAPNACLQLGYIYEKLGFRELARLHFEKAIAYKGYEYRSSVTQKAKAALAALH